MPPFVVQQDTPLAPAEAWARVTDWPAHGRFVPLTTVEVDTPAPTHAGTIFTAWTGVGRVRFADPMQVVTWDPPGTGHEPQAGFCRLAKQGSVMLGWAELRVVPHGPGSRVTWREEATPALLPGFATGAATVAGRLLFGRVLRKLLGG